MTDTEKQALRTVFGDEKIDRLKQAEEKRKVEKEDFRFDVAVYVKKAGSDVEIERVHTRDEVREILSMPKHTSKIRLNNKINLFFDKNAENRASVKDSKNRLNFWYGTAVFMKDNGYHQSI